MAKAPTCPCCHQFVEKNQPQKEYKKKTYHLACYKQMCDSLYRTEQERERVSPLSLSEKAPKQILEDYICKLFSIEEMTPFLYNQLNKMCVENPSYTYDGIRGSLYYFFEIKDNKPDIKYGINIVPYVYVEAKEFFEKRKHLIQQSQSLQINHNTVIVKTRQRKNSNKRIIDISKL